MGCVKLKGRSIIEEETKWYKFKHNLPRPISAGLRGQGSCPPCSEWIDFFFFFLINLQYLVALTQGS